eukprot:scaffold3416_cov133-Isochrysis_galbana.AAC.3
MHGYVFTGLPKEGGDEQAGGHRGTQGAQRCRCVGAPKALSFSFKSQVETRPSSRPHLRSTPTLNKHSDPNAHGRQSRHPAYVEG